jgi:hypothetical protein
LHPKPFVAPPWLMTVSPWYFDVLAVFLIPSHSIDSLSIGFLSLGGPSNHSSRNRRWSFSGVPKFLDGRSSQ